MRQPRLALSGGAWNLQSLGTRHRGRKHQPDDLRRQRERVEQLEGMAREGKAAYVNLGALLLRDLPGSAFRRALSDAGFAVTDLPLNPHTRRAVLQSLDILYSRS